MPETDDLSERLAALEAQAAHHEKAIDELSDMVARQWAKIDELTTEVGRLKNRLEEAGTATRPVENDSVPSPVD